jgi:two-component system, response regulator PdtaR
LGKDRFVHLIESSISGNGEAHRLSHRPLGACPVFARDDVSGASEQAREPVRIMIVEDDFLIASEIEGALVEAGYEVAGIAGSADEAIAIAAARHPLLAVMDIRLVGPRDGIDVALELFGTHGVRCIFATAHQNPEARERAKAANPLAWVPKPYSMASLIEIVRQAVRNWRGESGQ